MTNLKDEILRLTAKYASQKLAPPEFVPGKTYIPPSKKLLDPRDVEFMIEAVLDMWLTSGRVSEDFEKKISGTKN